MNSLLHIAFHIFPLLLSNVPNKTKSIDWCTKNNKMNAPATSTVAVHFDTDSVIHNVKQEICFSLLPHFYICVGTLDTSEHHSVTMMTTERHITSSNTSPYWKIMWWAQCIKCLTFWDCNSLSCCHKVERCTVHTGYRKREWEESLLEIMNGWRPQGTLHVMHAM